MAVTLAQAKNYLKLDNDITDDDDQARYQFIIVGNVII